LGLYLQYTRKKLTNIAKKALRAITKSPFNSHTKPIFLENNLLNIAQIKFIQTCQFMYKFHNNLLPPSFAPYFSLLPHTINTRSNEDYRSIFARTNTRQFSIKYQGPVSWNRLPKPIRSAISYVHFGILVRAFTIENVI